jgi:hypothetical protein
LSSTDACRSLQGGQGTVKHVGKSWLLKVLAGTVATVALAVVACSSSSSGGASCNSSPWQCAAGTTCWPQCGCRSGGNCTLANCTLQFSCLTSGTLTEGDSCSLSVGTQQAVCGDNMTCVSFADAGAGSCRPYCTQSQGCAAGESCVELEVTVGMSSASEHVCVPPAIDMDASLMLPETGTGSGGNPSSDGSFTDVALDGLAEAHLMQ